MILLMLCKIIIAGIDTVTGAICHVLCLPSEVRRLHSPSISIVIGLKVLTSLEGWSSHCIFICAFTAVDTRVHCLTLSLLYLLEIFRVVFVLFGGCILRRDIGRLLALQELSFWFLTRLILVLIIHAAITHFTLL